MSSPRPLQVGDVVKFRDVHPPDRPWGLFVIESRRSRKYFWLDVFPTAERPLLGRLKAHWRSLELVTPVEERVAEMLMETGR